MADAKISALTEKTAAVAADEVAIHDSADASNSKRVSLANLVKGMKLDDTAAPDDNTDRDATTLLHGLLPKLDKVKLDGIEALADVTDATNVDAAGAVMNGDTSTAGMSFVVDEDSMVSNLATKVPTQQSTKAYVDAQIAAVVAGSAVVAPLLVAANDATAIEKLAAASSGTTVCDGTADQVQIQAAIDACSGTRLQVVVLVGNFVISAPIVMESFVHLILQGKVTLVNAGNVDLMDITSKTDFIIEGGEWDGNDANQTGGRHGFDLSSCSDFIIRGVEIHDLKHETGVTSANGIYMTSCTNGQILNNYIHNNGTPGVSANATAIFLNANCVNCRVISNRIADCNGGIYIYGATGNTNHKNIISLNSLYNIERDGISLYNQDHVAGIVMYNKVLGNTIENAGLDADHPAIVLGNHGPCEYNSVIGNTCIGSATYTEGGIYCMGNYNDIEDNLIRITVGGRGIMIQDHVGDGSCGHDNNVINNRIYDTANSGCIHLIGAVDNYFADNVMSHTGRGILVDGNSDNNVFKDGSVNSPTSIAIDVDAGGTGNIFDNVHIKAGSITDGGTGTILRFNYSPATTVNPTDSRIDDTINSGDATTDGVIDAIRDALIAQKILTAS